MIRPLLFHIHWLLGMTAGLVLAIMGVTGAMMGFEDEVMTAFSPGIVRVEASSAPRLSPDGLIAAASAQRRGLGVATIVMPIDTDRAPHIVFDPPAGRQGRGERSYIAPQRGTLLGDANGQGFFAFVRAVHRWLALPGGGEGIGRRITGFSALALIFFALSGLYLRWPRKPLDWRSWLLLDLRRTGPNLYRMLHAVIGGWVLIFYLLSAMTGLWWSYDWYRQSATYVLTGTRAGPEETKPPAPVAPALPVPIDRAWASFNRVSHGRYQEATIVLPRGDGPVRIRALLADARHDRMLDQIEIDPVRGNILKIDRYADRPMGQVVISAMLEIHRGAFFGLPGRVVMTLASLAMPLFSVTGLLLYVSRRRRKKELRALTPSPSVACDASGPLIVHASQTGHAERRARMTASAFDNASVVPLAQLTPERLRSAGRALFIASTYGEGGPPDGARGFARQHMTSPALLAGLDYAVLALGDREYPDFCAFGHRLDHWLHDSGATRLFDLVKADGEDSHALHHWQQQLATIGGHGDRPDWRAPACTPWRLVERRLLNPGSVGGPAYHIALEPVDAAHAQWQAGDIAEIGPRNAPSKVAAFMAEARLDIADTVNGLPLADHLARSILPSPADHGALDSLLALPPLPRRAYSIASIPGCGQLQLLVRQVADPDGGLGLGSGWLTAFAPMGGAVDVRIRPNPGFGPPDSDRPMILIGNGTGLAGLLAHLRHRASTGGADAWLLLGERNRACDAFHDMALMALMASRILTRLDRTWSRDAAGGYVQDLVRAAAEDIRQWVARGAAILVCGSLKGMAPQVDAMLRAILGDDRVEAMLDDGRYRKDIY
ncbi:PepSY domain-containing protein [Sphingobium aquiterrae]|uniref:PepSY domain-containing protein n=1 Tax=Sphingobium aquiterrae TaxID=2038656 RepID=UPI003019062B